MSCLLIIENKYKDYLEMYNIPKKVACDPVNVKIIEDYNKAMIKNEETCYSGDDYSDDDDNDPTKKGRKIHFEAVNRLTKLVDSWTEKYESVLHSSYPYGLNYKGRVIFITLV